MCSHAPASFIWKRSMCGINGIFAYHSASSAPEETELLATREAMRARGPDGSGAWWIGDRHCGLGHRRLSIIDLSDRASQPMTSEDGRSVRSEEHTSEL